MIKIKKKDFWKVRSELYNCLSWVKDDSYLNDYIKLGDFKKSDRVLDVGTGTGVVADAIAPLVKEVVGLDSCKHMLSKGNWIGNKKCVNEDIRNTSFDDYSFDKVSARMVFHHILENTEEAMSECFRVLKKNGKIILAEGVPPIREVKKDYEEIFKLKEDRLTFLEDDLVKLMMNAGFKVKVYPHVIEKFSVRNWLENSGLEKEKRDRIFEMHVTSNNIFKKAYNMKIVNGDCLIDTKNLILVGKK